MYLLSFFEIKVNPFVLYRRSEALQQLRYLIFDYRQKRGRQKRLIIAKKKKL